MSVCQAVRAPLHAAPAVTILPRVDLRAGVIAGGYVEGGGDLELDDWIAQAFEAQAIWRAAGRTQPLSARAPAYLFEAGAASRLDALLRGAGFAMRAVTIEIEERTLAYAGAAGMAAVERLRARGWGVGLLCAPDCPLPLGQRARSLFTEILAPVPEDLSPALALADPDATALSRRIRAAKAAGLPVTALGVASPAQASLLLALGFDRGAGPGYRL
ncbi:MAG: hypothetical protein AB7M12_08625 [Hyphomonadaceae bacterium]